MPEKSAMPSLPVVTSIEFSVPCSFRVNFAPSSSFEASALSVFVICRFSWVVMVLVKAFPSMVRV